MVDTSGDGFKIRPSMTSSYSDCNLRAMVKAFPELFTSLGYTVHRNLPSIAAAVGTGVHAGAAASLQAVIRTGQMCSSADAEEQAILAFRGELASADEVNTDTITPSPSHAEKQIAKMLESYRVDVAPTITPLRVETRLEANAGDGFFVSGQTDVVTVGPDGIDDTKTGALDRVHMAQMGSYSLILRAHGAKIDYLRQTFIQRVALSKEQPKPQITTYDVGVAERVAEGAINRIKADVNALIKTGDPMAIQANPSSMLCSAKWCPAHGTAICRRHKGAT